MKTNPKEAEIERLRPSPDPADLVGLTVASAELLPRVYHRQGALVLRLTFTNGSIFDIRGKGEGDEDTGVEIHFP